MKKQKVQAKINLEALAGGAFAEKLNEALMQVAENIQNPNTEATTKRQITVNIKFTPNKTRQMVGTQIAVTTKLAATEAIDTQMVMGVNMRTGQIEMEKLRAEADMKRSKADMAAMQLKELEGKMHRSEDVEAVTNDLVYTVRSMIMALPGRLAMDVVQVASANEASALIRAECYKILNELANYNYDPAVYQRRVRDREGWSDVIVAADEADD